jgi:hypothetical protein
MFAASTANVCQPRLRSIVRAETERTVSVESTSPAKDKVQNGVTWRSTDRCDWSNQTQRRLSSKEGTVPTAVASTLATTASTPNRPTRTPSTVRLVTVDMPDTAE